MFLGGAIPTKDAQNQVGSLSSDLSTQQRIQHWVDLVGKGAPIEEIHQAEMELAKALNQEPFAIREQIPFFQQIVRKLDATRAFQHFRLPGRDRVVEDKREQHEQGKPAESVKDAAKEISKNVASKEAAKDEAKESMEKDKSGHSKGEMRLQEGRLVKQKEKGYANYLADRSDVSRRGSELNQDAASERVEKMLSAFERMVIARFEGGRKIAEDCLDGRAKFLAKSEGQWREFFKSFIDRTVQKKALLSDISEFLFRGFVSKGTKGVFIGDINFANGRIEKFVRFSIFAEALAKLKALVPGEAVAKGALGGLSGEDLMYLALAVSRARETMTSMMPAQGKFIGGRAEAAAAEALGIPIDMHLRQKAKGLRGSKGGLLKGRFLGDEEPDDLPYQFIPWWQWGNLKQQGPKRWITAVFYGTLFIMTIIGLVAMTVRLLGGI